MSEISTVQLADCERTLIDEIASGAPQRSVAMTYALALRSSERPSINWKRVNQAIITRWSRSGLARIKQWAWSGKCFND